MDRLKQWLALSLVALLAILAGGWFLLIAPEHSEAEEVRAQAEAAQGVNSQLETQLKVLRAKAEQLPAKRAELAEVAEKVPTGASLPVLVRALTAAAREAGVELTSVTPGTPVALAAAVPAGRRWHRPRTQPRTQLRTQPRTQPLCPSPPPLRFQPPDCRRSLVVLDAEGDFYELEEFLAELKDLPRALRVTSLVVQAGEDGGTGSGKGLRATVTASAYARAASASAPVPVPAAPAVQGASDGAVPVPPATGTAPPPTAPSS